MFNKNAKSRKVTINRILIIVAVICSIFAVGMILLPFINNASVNKEIKGSNDMQVNYTSSESNTWDVSENGDGSVIATFLEDGTLIISGSGEIKSWTSSMSVPWYDILSQIKSVKIEEGITRIGNLAFNNCNNLTNVIIPEGVTYIAVSAFGGCDSLIEIKIPSTVESFGEKNNFNACFYRCKNLKNIKVDENNKIYCDDDGVLFSKDKTKIIRYPEGKTESTYIIPSEVTSMEKKVFENCKNLTNIEIPGNISKIEYGAFYECSGLIEIRIQEGVTRIGQYAFTGCSNIKEITIPSSITYIDDEALQCSNLIAINVSQNNETYDDDNGVLYTKDKTEIIKYPEGKKDTTYIILNGVTSIGEDAFRGCRSLTEITIPSSVTSIGGGAFEGCSSLKKITIPEGTTIIGSGAFYGCSSLTEITIPEGITSIGSQMFRQCSSLKEIIVPESVTSIGSYAFYECSSLNGIILPVNVTSIGNNAFYECTSLKEITIPSAVDTIGNKVFDRCKVTNIINIDNSIVKLPEILIRAQDGNDILYSSKEFILENCTIEEGNIKIKDGKNYASIKVQDGILNGLTYIISYGTWNISEAEGESVKAELSDEGILTISGNGNMKNWNSASAPWYICKEQIREIEIREGVTTIGDYAFIGCNKLTKIIFPKGVTSIGYNALGGCNKLTEIVFQEGLTIIEGNVFYGCDKLASITIPEGVTCIGNSAFFGCSSLKEISIPASVENIEYYAFSRCSNLTEIEVHPDNRTYCDDNGILFTKDKKEIVCYPAGKIEEKYTISGEVINIRNGAFARNSYLKEITIQEGVTSIGWYAFEYCYNLVSIQIPNSVTNIQGYVFEGCRNVTILCYSESTSEIYAQTNEIAYEIMHLKSEQQIIDEGKLIIKGIETKTTVEKIKTSIQSDISYEILDKEGNVLKETSIVGTGYVIKLSNDKNYTLIVMGDINGDGKIGISELARASRLGISQEGASEIEIMAVDVNMDGNIKVNDLAAISRLARQ